MVFAVGLTGNIASGKTTAAKIFSNMGIEVINADQVSRDLTLKGTPAYEKIVAHYGTRIVLEDGQLNRRLLREIIFSDPDERTWLEALLHPLIRTQLEKRVKLCSAAYCVVEIPLLLSREHYPYLNKILVITALQELQITRVMERDQCSREQAQAILSTQPNIDLRLKNADDVVINDSGLEALKLKLEQLHFKYLNNATSGQ